MEITGIELNCHSTGNVNSENLNEFQLVFFRSPIVYSASGSDRVIRSSSAIIFTGGHKHVYRSANGRPIKYDSVTFIPSNSDKQYITSMEIQLDTPLEVSDDHIMSNTLKSMKLYSMKKSVHTKDFMSSAMKMLFICLSGKVDSGNDQSSAVPKYSRLKALRDSVFDDPLNDWSVDWICKEMHISKTYFHRIYFNAFGVTFLQDVIESRLVYAAELLVNTDLSISKVAERCGYESDSYFMRQFKKQKGCTPTEYRRKMLEEKENNENPGKKQ